MTAAWVGGAYLVGSIPFSYLIVRRARRIDVRSVGSGNVGATNVMRAAGWQAAVVALVFDLLKGAAPVWAASTAGTGAFVAALVGFAAVLGHVFPVFLGFRGGKGVATAAGAYAALSPVALMITAVVFGIVVGVSRIVSLGSLAAAVAFPVAWVAAARLGGVTEPSAGVLALLAALTVLVFWTHRGNLRRLARGEESRLGARS